MQLSGRLQHSFVPQRGPHGRPARGPRTDQSALGALKPATHNQVKRQLSVIVNVDTQLHNGKINGAIGDINLNSTRPFRLSHHSCKALNEWAGEGGNGEGGGRAGGKGVGGGKGRRRERKRTCRTDSDLYWPFLHPSQGVMLSFEDCVHLTGGQVAGRPNSPKNRPMLLFVVFLGKAS